MLERIVSYCDRVLRVSKVRDYDRASNGLQVQNDGKVTRITAAVDGTLATVRKAVSAGADLMIVHHGLFWGATHPWTGRRYELLKTLLDNNLAVYSAHLPLDVHPRFGNNALLCKALGMRKLKPFLLYKEQFSGFRAEMRLPREDLAARLEQAVHARPLVIAAGPKICRKVGVVTGGAGDGIEQAAAEGVDTFITGEGKHSTFAKAEELGINVMYGGHYATETFGVKALAEHLAKKFRLDWRFIDHPTGL